MKVCFYLQQIQIQAIVLCTSTEECQTISCSVQDLYKASQIQFNQRKIEKFSPDLNELRVGVDLSESLLRYLKLIQKLNTASPCLVWTFRDTKQTCPRSSERFGQFIRNKALSALLTNSVYDDVVSMMFMVSFPPLAHPQSSQEDASHPCSHCMP